MKHIKRLKFILISCILSSFFLANISLSDNLNQNKAVVTNQIFEKVKQNKNWKLAFLTAKDAQVVFMTISPDTNSNNEIGMETHKFDQIIFVVEGDGKAVLNGKSIMVKPGDMILIPQGVEHNVINLNAKNPLKILSVYSATDIPANTAYKKKSDVPKE